MKRCAGYWRDTATQAGWRRCCSQAEHSRFCGKHAEALQGALLGLVVLESEGLTASEMWYGKRTFAIYKRQREKRRNENKKAEEHGGIGGEASASAGEREAGV